MLGRYLAFRAFRLAGPGGGRQSAMQDGLDLSGLVAKVLVLGHIKAVEPRGNVGRKMVARSLKMCSMGIRLFS